MHLALSIIAGIIQFVAFFPYLRSILRGDTIPVKSTWITWAVLDVSMLISLAATKTLNGQIIMATFSASTIAILSLTRGKPGWSKLDIACLTCAFVGIALWIAFNDPRINILINAAVNVVGIIPTLRSVWEDPSREDRLTWTLFFISCVLVTGSLTTWTIASAAQPLAFLTLNTLIVSILYFKPRQTKANS